MNFFQSIKFVYVNYFVYKTRSPRSEYWWYYLFYVLACFLLGILDTLLVFISPYFFGFSILTNLFVILSLIPGLMLAIRRFHDLNRSGFWVLINLIPLVGWIICAVWFCRKGTTGPNRFGEDPLKT